MLWPDGPFIPFTPKETEAHSLSRFTRQIFIEYCAWDTDLDSQFNKKSGNIQIDNCSKKSRGFIKQYNTQKYMHVLYSKRNYATGADNSPYRNHRQTMRNIL